MNGKILILPSQMYRSLFVLLTFLAVSRGDCDAPEVQLYGAANQTLANGQCVAKLTERYISRLCAEMYSCWFNTTVNYPNHARSIQITDGGFNKRYRIWVSKANCTTAEMSVIWRSTPGMKLYVGYNGTNIYNTCTQSQLYCDCR